MRLTIAVSLALFAFLALPAPGQDERFQAIRNALALSAEQMQRLEQGTQGGSLLHLERRAAEQTRTHRRSPAAGPGVSGCQPGLDRQARTRALLSVRQFRELQHLAIGT